MSQKSCYLCDSEGVSKATAVVQEQPYTRYVSSFKKQLATSFAQQIAKDMRICSPGVAPQVSAVLPHDRMCTDLLAYSNLIMCSQYSLPRLAHMPCTAVQSSCSHQNVKCPAPVQAACMVAVDTAADRILATLDIRPPCCMTGQPVKGVPPVSLRSMFDIGQSLPGRSQHECAAAEGSIVCQ